MFMNSDRRTKTDITTALTQPQQMELIQALMNEHFNSLNEDHPMTTEQDVTELSAKLTEIFKQSGMQNAEVKLLGKIINGKVMSNNLVFRVTDGDNQFIVKFGNTRATVSVALEELSKSGKPKWLVDTYAEATRQIEDPLLRRNPPPFNANLDESLSIIEACIPLTKQIEDLHTENPQDIQTKITQMATKVGGDLAKIFRTMHDSNVVWTDLKCGNLLMRQDGSLAIADTKAFRRVDQFLTRRDGTIEYDGQTTANHISKDTKTDCKPEEALSAWDFEYRYQMAVVLYMVATNIDKLNNENFEFDKFDYFKTDEGKQLQFIIEKLSNPDPTQSMHYEDAAVLLKNIKENKVYNSYLKLINNEYQQELDKLTEAKGNVDELDNQKRSELKQSLSALIEQLNKLKKEIPKHREGEFNTLLENAKKEYQTYIQRDLKDFKEGKLESELNQVLKQHGQWETMDVAARNQAEASLANLIKQFTDISKLINGEEKTKLYELYGKALSELSEVRAIETPLAPIEPQQVASTLDDETKVSLNQRYGTDIHNMFELIRAISPDDLAEMLSVLEESSEYESKDQLIAAFPPNIRDAFNQILLIDTAIKQDIQTKLGKSTFGNEEIEKAWSDALIAAGVELKKEDLDNIFAKIRYIDTQVTKETSRKDGLDFTIFNRLEAYMTRGYDIPKIFEIDPNNIQGKLDDLEQLDRRAGQHFDTLIESNPKLQAPLSRQQADEAKLLKEQMRELRDEKDKPIQDSVDKLSNKVDNINYLKVLHKALENPKLFSMKHNPINATMNFRALKNAPTRLIVDFILAHPEVTDIFLKQRHITGVVGRNFRDDIRREGYLTELENNPEIKSKLITRDLSLATPLPMTKEQSSRSQLYSNPYPSHLKSDGEILNFYTDKISSLCNQVQNCTELSASEEYSVRTEFKTFQPATKEAVEKKKLDKTEYCLEYAHRMIEEIKKTDLSTTSKNDLYTQINKQIALLTEIKESLTSTPRRLGM